MKATATMLAKRNICSLLICLTLVVCSLTYHNVQSAHFCFLFYINDQVQNANINMNNNIETNTQHEHAL